MNLLTWLALYILVGSLVGLSLSRYPQFTVVNQWVGAAMWPVVVAVFAWSFCRSFARRED